MPDHPICLLRNLHGSQEATVKTGHGTTDWFQIGKRLHQGCILSPCWTELNFTPFCQLGNFTLKRLANRGSQNKQRRGNGLEVTSATDLNPAFNTGDIWGALIHLEYMYNLEQGTLLHGTDPTLPTTGPEKLLDIYFYYHFLIKKT